MERNRIVIIVVIICVLILLIALPANFISRSKTNENRTSTIFMKTTKDTITTIGKTQIATSNNIETSTSNQIPDWIVDASLKQGRSGFGSALLTDGRIIISGGLINITRVVRTSENYSSSFGWQITTSMKASRYLHTLTAFADNTKALATGSGFSAARRTAEVFDSITNTWTYTSNNMSSDRYYHTATLLGNGQILIVGGINGSNIATNSVEIYVPSSNSFINTNNMVIGRYGHTTTLLSDGSTVLVTGGHDSKGSETSTAEIYIDGSWTRTNNDMIQSRIYHAAVLLNDGNVLITGGRFIIHSFITAEIYNATTRTFTVVDSMKYARDKFTLTLLPSGKVLATGGINWSVNTNTYPKVCELYDPLTKTWSDTNMLNYGRSHHQTILLNDSVLIIGGDNGSDSSQVAISEKYY